MPRYAFAAIFVSGLLALGTLAACGGGSSINGDVSVAAGQTAGDVATVNGSVNVGDGATVGGAMTVNGGVTLGANVTAKSVKTVNGEVRLGEAAKVSGGVLSVNGALTLEKGADVSGKIANVNGDIQLTTAHVGGGITTINGDIEVGRDSRVEGGIHVDKPDFSGDMKNTRVPRIVIGPGAVVQGPLLFERAVKLYVSDSAQIGPVEGATPELFSGEQPGDVVQAADAGTAAATGGPEKE